MTRKGTKNERRAYQAAANRGTLGSEVVYGSRPATDAQMAAIERMARKAGYSPGQAIKNAIGKNPVGGLNRERASTVIEHLAAKLDR